MRRRGWASVAIVALLSGVLSGCGEVRTRMTLNKGNELYTAQKYEEAIAEYEKILEYDKDNWMANYLIAMSYVALYRPGSTHDKDVEYNDKGISRLETLLTLEAPSKEEREKIEGYYLSMLTSAQKNDKAIAYLEEKFAKSPTDATLASRIGKLAFDSGNVEKALEYMEKRAKLQPDDKTAWYTIGVTCWARSYHGGLMVSQDERNQLIERGMEALDKALAIDPDYFDALSYTNLLYREKMKALVTEGKNVEAQEAFAKAEEYLKKALEVRKKQQEQQGAAGA